MLTKTLYDTDFFEWADATAKLLRQGRLDEVDLEHVAEEIESLGKSDRRTVASQLLRLLMHLIKQRIQPERAGTSWRASVINARQEIDLLFQDSPSLRPYFEETLEETYRQAVKQALDETNLKSKAKQLEIPETCPYTLDELLEGDLNDLWPR
jgi:hypothetical protein